MTCCQVEHVSLNHWRINPVWQSISWTDKMQKAFVKCVCLWLLMLLQLVPTIINGSACTLTPLWLPAKHVYYQRRNAGYLLFLKTDSVTAKSYYIGKRNTFNHSYSQRILRYSPRRTFTFLWNIQTWCSILSKHNACYAAMWKLNSFHPLIR